MLEVRHEFYGQGGFGPDPEDARLERGVRGPRARLDPYGWQDAAGIGSAQQHVDVGHLARIGPVQRDGRARNDSPRFVRGSH